MGRIKNVQISTGTSAGTVTGIDGTATAKSASYTITDTDRIRTVLVTTGGTSFTFVDADVTVGSDIITETAHGMSDGQLVYMTNSGGRLPAGLHPYRPYFVVSSAANTFKVSGTLGGAAIDITAAAGGGTHTVIQGPTITLPAVATNTGRRITVKKVDSGVGFLYVSGTIDGSTSPQYNCLYSQYGTMTVVCDGSNWYWEQVPTDLGSVSGAIAIGGNISGSPTYTLNYTRTGRAVNFWGVFTIDPTAAATTSGSVDPPIYSNFSSTHHAGGTGVSDSAAYDPILIKANAGSSDNLGFEYLANSALNANIGVSGGYTII